ncbi:MAG: ribokinase [Acidobacteriota bacterium]
MTPKIVVVGSFNADLMAYTERLPRPGETVAGHRFALGAGGKGTNQAVAAARLGAEVSFVGRIGQDVFAQSALDLWRREGIDATYVVQDADVSTGVAPVLVDDAGENSIVVVLGANLALSRSDVEEASDLIAGADVLLTQLEVADEATTAALELARRSGTTSILNPAPATAVARETLELADWLTPNETELETLSGAHGVSPPLRSGQRLAITLGASGAVYVGEGARVDVPAPRVAAVDTTGAGDAFNGALAVALAEGAEPVEAIRFANAAAALSVTRHGTSASMATRVEVDEALRV